jgi:hypothetical protein
MKTMVHSELVAAHGSALKQHASPAASFGFAWHLLSIWLEQQVCGVQPGLSWSLDRTAHYFSLSPTGGPQLGGGHRHLHNSSSSRG